MAFVDPSARGGGRVRIDRDWHERIVIPDGRHIELRLVRPEDKPLFARGIAQLSAEARFRRFLSNKQRFSDADLRYLTECDGTDHFAVAAVGRDEGGQRLLIGVVRCIRLRDDPEAGEIAVVVLDEAQNQGVGTLLLSRLARAARQRGIQRCRSEVLASNEPVRSLISEIAPQVRMRPSPDDPDLLLMEFDLDETLPDDGPIRESGLYHVLRLLADGFLSLRRLFGSSSEDR